MSGGPRPDVRPGSRDRLRIAGVVLWSVAVWVALWGTLSVANLLWGAVLGAATVLVLPVVHRDHRVPIRPLAALRFVGLFVWSLVTSSAVVAWEVVTPGSRINEGIVAVPLRTTSPGLITVIGNSVSLTPGTLTLEVRHDPPTLYVHVLHLRSLEDARASVHHLEDVVLAAFGDDAHDDPPAGRPTS